MIHPANQQAPLKRKWIYLFVFIVLTQLYNPRFSLLNSAQGRGLKQAQLTRKIELTIIRCHDGDTCTGEDLLHKKYTLRLLGVDAPEVSWARKKGQIFGQEAKRFIESHVKGKKYTVEIQGNDVYGRFLAIIKDPGLQNKSNSINQLMIEEGFAFAYSGPQAKDISEWSQQAQSYAQKNKKGLWSLKERPEDPKFFRSRNR